MLNTHFCRQLTSKCFSVCYTNFRETIALLAQKLYALGNVVSPRRWCNKQRNK
jgi:hypothetical protein